MNTLADLAADYDNAVHKLAVAIDVRAGEAGRLVLLDQVDSDLIAKLVLEYRAARRAYFDHGKKAV